MNEKEVEEGLPTPESLVAVQPARPAAECKQAAISKLVAFLNDNATVADIESAVRMLELSKAKADRMLVKRTGPPESLTIQNLRAEQIKVRVTHCRMLKPENPFKEIADLYDHVVENDLTVPRLGFIEQFVVPWKNVIATRGGVTVVELTTPDGESVSGQAWCSDQDNYCRKSGVRFALGRAIVMLSDEAIAKSPLLTEAAAYWKTELATYIEQEKQKQERRAAIQESAASLFASLGLGVDPATGQMTQLTPDQVPATEEGACCGDNGACSHCDTSEPTPTEPEPVASAT